MELTIISVKNFFKPNLYERIVTNNILEKNYKKYKVEDQFNYPIRDNTKIFDNLYDKFLSKCAKAFGNFSIHEQNLKTCYCYRSNVSNSVSVMHNHIDTAIVTGVYYHQISKGDSISFFCLDQEEKYYPENGELIIFPSFYDHKPNPTNSKRNRYSINMELITKESSMDLFNRI